MGIAIKFAVFSPLILLVACSTTLDEPVFDNPLDPDYGGHTAPETTIETGPLEGAIVSSAEVTFTWSGNDNVSEYSYRLISSGLETWTSTTELSATFGYLDEGTYKFEVKGAYASGEEDPSPDFRNFTVDAIQGPAIWLYPRKSSVKTGGIFSVEIYLEDVVNVKGIWATLQFNSSMLQISDLTIYENAESLLKKNGGVVLHISGIDNVAGFASIEAVIATGSPPGVSGTGPIAEITFSPLKSGNSTITFISPTELRDSGNLKIDDDALTEIGSVVEVQ